MNKYFTSFIVLVILMGCSKPISHSKITQSFTLQKNFFINHITFNNLANHLLYLDEEKIEKRVLKELNKNKNSLSINPMELTINLVSIEETNINKRNFFNIHNVMGTAVMLTTGVTVDTSTIDSNQIKKTIFILNLTLKKEKSKLFIEISDYNDAKELKELFEVELIHKIEEIF